MAELRADPFATEWITAKKSAARLIAAPSQTHGAYRAGVQIRLDRGALTYWRFPGEAGSPPQFDFAGSENLKDVIVHYPAPARIDEAGLDAFGYRDSVTFPIDVKLADDSRPGVLALSLKYAVCGGICLPVSAAARLTLPPRSEGPAASPEAFAAEVLIAAADARVPQRLSAVERDAKVAISWSKSAEQPTWRVHVRGTPRTETEASPDAESIAQDIFIESPEGWYFESKKGDKPNEFLIIEVEAPDDGSPASKSAADVSKIPVTITLVEPRQSYEFSADLEAGPGYKDIATGLTEAQGIQEK